MLLTERPTILSLVWKTGWAGTPSGCDVTGLLKLCWETKVCKRGNMNNAGWSAGCLLRSARTIQPLLLHCLHRSTPQWPSTAQPPCVFMPSYVFSLNCGFVALLAWRAASMKAWKRGEPKPKTGFMCFIFDFNMLFSYTMSSSGLLFYLLFVWAWLCFSLRCTRSGHLFSVFILHFSSMLLFYLIYLI